MIKLTKKSWFIVISVLFSALLMSFIDGFIEPPYIYKSLLKLLLFFLIPLIYLIGFARQTDSLKNLFIPRKKDFLIALSLGAGVFAVIISAYLLLRKHIDFSAITDSLTSGIGVNADNFIFVAIYISFVNSLLEEFFFRGYAFILLREEVGRTFAYIFSASLFAFYHVGMTAGWFNIAVYILAMLGLFVGGCIFNFLNEKCKNIYPSWLVHMCANFAINTIGLIMFGII